MTPPSIEPAVTDDGWQSGPVAERRSVPSARSDRVLLIHGGALGDLVLSLFLLRSLPAGSRQALCRNRLACFFARRGYLLGWKSLEHPAYAWMFSVDAGAPPKFTLDFDSFDAVISLLGDDTTDFARRLGAVCRNRPYCIDPRVRTATADRGTHILDQWLADLRARGLALDRDACLRSEALICRPPPGGDPLVWIHPGSGGVAKCWHLEGYEQLAAHLQARGLAVRFMLGPAEVERGGPALSRRLARIAAVCHQEDVCDAAAAVQQAALFIGNDAGMTHVAAALGVPTFVIFQSSNPTVWRPLGPQVAVFDARCPPKPVLQDLMDRAAAVLR